MREFLVLVLVVLAAQGTCGHGAEDVNGPLSMNAATCADDTCNAVSLLQVSAARRNGSEPAAFSGNEAESDFEEDNWVISKKPRAEALSLDQNGDGWKLTTEDGKGIRWLFGSYHKTGCELSIGICWALGKRTPNHAGRNIREGVGVHGKHLHGVQSAFTTYAFNNWYFEPKYSVILQLPHYRYVHMIREPADWIVSCYTWHSIPDQFTEGWLAKPMKRNFNLKACPDENNCMWDDYFRYGLLPKIVHDQSSLSELVDPEYRQLLHKFNNSVNAGKTMPQFYSEVSQMEGVVVEAYRTRATIDLMVANYLSSRNDQHSVQVRMETIKQDFEGSMRCMMTFLKRSWDFDIDWAMKGIDQLNVQKYGQQAAQKGGKSEPWHYSTMSAEQKEKLLNRLNSLSFVVESKNLLTKPAVNDC